MMAVFAMLWTLCVIKTFDHMTASHRYAIVAAECTLYPAIAVFVFRSRRMMRRFGGGVWKATHQARPPVGL